jgi:indolepyruvate ferredoxin oxidoreductase
VEGDLKSKSKKLQISDIEFENNIPEPKKLIIKDVFSILLNGIGGTGVVTVAAILGMASRLEGKKFSALDMAGLAQKGGSVWSHMIISEPSTEINSPRIPNGDSDVLLGCDLVVSASKKTREILSKDTFCVVNTKKQMTGDFARNSNLTFPYKNLLDKLQGTVSENNVFLQNFSKLAEDYIGDAIFGNIILLGYAFQKGLIPLTSKSIETAIEINGVSVKKNIEAFCLGRNLALKNDQIKDKKYEQEKLDDFINYRGNFLRDYQNKEYSKKYLNAIASFSDLKTDSTKKEKIVKVVAQNYFKLLSYKDEYEVARLHDSDEFKKSIEEQFEKGFKIKFNLAPAIFGNKQKYQFGSWMKLFFKILKNLKFLRGTTFDIFGYTEERKIEKKLINIYEEDISYVINSFESEKLDHFIEFLNWPIEIKGYGHVKSKSIDKAIDNRKNILSIKI